jgi:hypothetical protein
VKLPLGEFYHPHLNLKIRLIGLLPIFFFLLRFIALYKNNTPQEILWICHLNNLFLGIGILILSAFIIRTMFIWLIIGLPLWLINLMLSGDFTLTSAATHFGGVLIGGYFFFKLIPKRGSWLPAILWMTLMQLICHLFTDPSLNINTSFQMRPEYQWLFTAYWQYWLYMIASLSAALWTTDFLFFKLLKYYRPKIEKSRYA